MTTCDKCGKALAGKRRITGLCSVCWTAQRLAATATAAKERAATKRHDWHKPIVATAAPERYYCPSNPPLDRHVLDDQGGGEYKCLRCGKTIAIGEKG